MNYPTDDSEPFYLRFAVKNVRKGYDEAEVFTNNEFFRMLDIIKGNCITQSEKEFENLCDAIKHRTELLIPADLVERFRVFLVPIVASAMKEYEADECPYILARQFTKFYLILLEGKEVSMRRKS